MTNDEVLSKIKIMFEKRAEMRALQKQKQDAEIALNVQYKVEECNQKKNELSMQYRFPIQALTKEIFDIEAELGVKES